MNTKECSRKDCHKAGIPQSIDEFYFDKTGGRHRAECRNCKLKDKKKRRKARPETRQSERNSAKKYKDKHKHEAWFKIINNLRRSFGEHVGAGNGGLMKYLGCTTEELMEHLESRFQEGMTFENYGQGGWEIDHIFPTARTNPEDWTHRDIVWHYTNLQPLWARQNSNKADKLNTGYLYTILNNTTHNQLQLF